MWLLRGICMLRWSVMLFEVQYVTHLVHVATPPPCTVLLFALSLLLSDHVLNRAGCNVLLVKSLFVCCRGEGWCVCLCVVLWWWSSVPTVPEAARKRCEVLSISMLSFFFFFQKGVWASLLAKANTVLRLNFSCNKPFSSTCKVCHVWLLLERVCNRVCELLSCTEKYSRACSVRSSLACTLISSQLNWTR